MNRFLALSLLSLGLTLSTAAAQVILREVTGTVEQQRGTWQLARSGDNILQSLRTGTGRTTFQNGDNAQVLMGSSSALGLYQNEPNFQSGRFYVTGDGRFYVQGIHYFTSGRVRIDLQGNVQRIAVIAGSLRIAVNSTVSTIRSGQQYDIKTLKVSPFSEKDPWYLSRFAGVGEAQVEAVNGSVTLQNADGSASHAVQPIESLQPGQVLSTGDKSWAEVGFTGGGYLRLQPQSAVSVISVEKTVRGREVQLKLLRGSAWNVVSKGQGGYQITTPTVTTAVRGTTFRVDATGLVKVFNGKVALPTNSDMLLPAGQQISPEGQTGDLKLEQSDLENEALDAAHNAPLELRLHLQPAQQQLSLTVDSQPTSQITVTITPQGAASLSSIALKAHSGTFQLQRDLPEGRYTVQVVAERFGQRQELSASVLIDRQAPQLSWQIKRSGHLATLSGQVSDASDVLLLATLGDKTYTHWVKTSGKAATFEWALPISTPQQFLQLSATDQAGNTTQNIRPATVMRQGADKDYATQRP